jgi:hypothetical protein
MKAVKKQTNKQEIGRTLLAFMGAGTQKVFFFVTAFSEGKSVTEERLFYSADTRYCCCPSPTTVPVVVVVVVRHTCRISLRERVAHPEPSVVVICVPVA